MAHDAEAVPRLESPGVSVRPVLWAALASIALMLGAIWGLSAVHDWRLGNRTLPATEQFPAPRVQTHQAEQRQELLAAQRRQLVGYAWTDASRTLVRIPIERAMEIIAQRGAAAYAPLLSPADAPAAPPAGAEPATTGQAQPPAPPPVTFGRSGPGAGTAHRLHGRPPPRRRH
jgi:hypothetical protein